MASKRSIRSEREKIGEQMECLRLKLVALQERCEHPAAEKTHKSDTGNWCKLDDCYWTDFYCPDCKKRWRMDGSV